MMKYRRTLKHLNPLPLMAIIIFIVSNLNSYVSASNFSDQFIDPTDDMFDASQWLSENAYGFLPMPIIITEPALGTGLGIVGLFFHESEEARDQRVEKAQTAENAAAYLLPPSVTAVAVGGTSNDTWFSGLGHFGFWKQDTIRYEGSGAYFSVNMDFYGSGDLEFPKPVSLNTEGYMIENVFKFRLPGSEVFLGVKQSLMNAEVSPNKTGLLDDILQGLPPELEDKLLGVLTKKTQTSALGFIIEYDSRDNLFTPQQGFNYSIEALVYDENIGSDFDYNRLLLEGLNYWSFAEKFVIGWRIQGDAIFTDDRLPPYAIPYIDLRGIAIGRYRGDRVAATELEGTWKLDSRWSLLAFGGGGRAADDWDSFKDASTQISKGAGFRYHVAKRYGFYMGVDVARGPEETAWYIQGGSAW